jgi:hypothetical protein
MSDLTSEMLPSDPLRRIFPLMVDDTNISLNMSLLSDYSRLLRLFYPDRSEDEYSFELYRVFVCGCSSLSVSGLGLNLRMIDRKSDLSASNSCTSRPSPSSIYSFGWLLGGVRRRLSVVGWRRVTLMNLLFLLAKGD